MAKPFWISLILILILKAHFILSLASPNKPSSSIKAQISNTGLLADSDDETIFISTLDGALHSITKTTGKIKWTIKEEPVIQNPNNSDQPSVPRFFPNPQDGSLYRYTFGRGREPLKKLPFTIPELVANSPCRSSDGIFYIGKKMDSWLGIDATTGKKQLVLGAETVEKVCPKTSRNTIYLGRTLYNIVLFEIHTGNKWNVSFYHYATNSASSHLDNYDLVHYAATGEGSILTVDQKTGAPLWNLDLQSPIVAMYLLAPDSSLVSIPVTTVTPQTLDRFAFYLEKSSHHDLTESSGALLIKELSPTIFVGETEFGVYALPALVDTNTARISKKQDQLLLGGPPGQRGIISQNKDEELEVENDEENASVLLLGYYDLPDSIKADLNSVTPSEIGSLSKVGIILGITHNSNTTDNYLHMKQIEDQDIFWDGFSEIKQFNVTFLLSQDFFFWTLKVCKVSFQWLVANPLHLMVMILTISFIFIIAILCKQAKEYARLSLEVSSRKQNSSRGSTGGGSGGEITAIAEELDDNRIRVGKVIFNPGQLLGKGCDGTFVFRGSFDGRDVAVKRVLPSCFTIADREVELLRASDQHPNVIRYYCMEQCREFRYIALELCAATLEDLVTGHFITDVPSLTFLRQATFGLHHLHSLDIVHRDIKPCNVLLSLPNAKGEVKAMISDFGLCKRLEVGRASFSRRSGVTGTEGWIAPEMLNSTERPNTKVDIFSLGCVFYYVLSGGKHPFGSLLDRQSNILSEKLNLDAMDSEADILQHSLIVKMLNNKDIERPPTPALLTHPLFWSNNKILQFFQDVSDRVEKETVNSIVLRNLEIGAQDIVKDDWTVLMHPCIGEDLRRFREYNGRSVRDLLRALRNKKNHYRELSDEARRVFGHIPEDFIPYWTSRFPRLLLHTWYAMQCCKSEPIFNKYYCSGYSFRPDNFHAIVSLSPNNRPFLSQEPPLEHYRSQNQNLLKTPKKKERFDPLDCILGPATKGLSRPPKQEREGVTSPLWVLKKKINLFEPQFSSKEETPKKEKESKSKDKKGNKIKRKSECELTEQTIKYGSDT